MYGTPQAQPAEPAPSIEEGQIVERKLACYSACVGFLAGCGCRACLQIDRDMQRSLDRARGLRNA